jgi:heat shock protein HtpX
MNAFSVGTSNNSAIAVSDGIIRYLSWREVAGVLAHEMSHIRNNDLRLLSLADFMTRITSILSFFGQILIILYLPLVFFSKANMPLMPILLLIFAPSLSIFLQLALSRTREFNADLGAAHLTGDPAGLASALIKMDQYDQSIWHYILFPGRKPQHPSILRTHPHTEERLKRLRSLDKEQIKPFMDLDNEKKMPVQFIQEDESRWNRLSSWQ